VIISLYILLPFGYEFNTKRFDVIFILIHVSSRKSEEKERTIPALSEYSVLEPMGSISICHGYFSGYFSFATNK